MQWSGLVDTSWVVVPAFLLALMVRLDARLIGPYFAMSSVITGLEGMTSGWWYDKPQMRFAFLRRVTYPALVGYALAFFDSARGASAWAVGTLAGVLLVWPIVFHGLPRFVSRRDREIITFYVAFILAYATLAQFGYFFWLWVQSRSDGRATDWMADQVLGSVGTFAAGLILSGVWHRASSSLSSKVIEREREAYEPGEVDWGGEPMQSQEEPSSSSDRHGINRLWLLVGIGGLGSIATLLAVRARNRRVG